MELFSFEEKEKNVKENLKDLGDLMNGVNINFWLTSGTLLGYVSMNSILPNDRDVDLGMYASERAKLTKIIPELQKKGFIVNERYDPAHERVKGMVTLQRGKVPIDIKLYDDYGDYVARAIHRSLSTKSAFIWHVIDILHFKSKNSIIKKRRMDFLYYFLKVFGVILLLVPENASKKLKSYLSKKWKNGDSWYGMEILPKKYLKSFKKVSFYGMTFNIFSNAEEYLDEVYGDDWGTHNPSGGKGGIEKYSHIVYSENLLEELKGDEELKRRCIAVGYL